MNDDVFGDLIPKQAGVQQPQQAVPQDYDNGAFADLVPKDPTNNSKYWEEDHGSFMAGVTAFNRGIERLTTGVLQGVTAAGSALGIPGADRAQQAIGQYNTTQEQEADLAFQQHPIAYGTGLVAAELGKGIAAGAPSSSLTLAQQALGMAGRAAAIGASEYGSAQERAERGLISGVTAGALTGAAGRLFGSREVAQEAADTLSSGGYLTLGQATRSEGIQAAERALSSVPVIGTGAGVRRAAGYISERADEALEGIGANSLSKTEAGEQIVRSVQSAYDDAVAKTNTAYNNFFKAAESAGNEPVALTRTQQVANDALTEINRLVDQQGFASAAPSSSRVKTLLEDFNVGADSTKAIDPANFETLRRSIKGAISEVKTSGKDSAFIKPLQDMQRALDDDLNAYGEGLGQTLNSLLQDARNIYQTEKLPLQKIRQFKSALSDTVDPDALVNSIIKNDSGFIMNKMMSRLDDNGKNALTGALFNRIATQSANEAGEVDPLKFASTLRRMGGTIDALPKQQRDTLHGVQKLIENSSRLLRSDGQTGGQLVGAVAAGAPGIAAATGGALGASFAPAAITAGISKLLTNQTFIKGLARLAGGKLSRDGEAKISQSLLDMLVPAAAISAGNIGDNASQGL